VASGRRNLQCDSRLTGTSHRGPARARTAIDQDIVAWVMATLTTGEHSSRLRDGEQASRGSIAMVETWRVTLGRIRQRLLGHETGRGRRAVVFALAGA
jgi:hypothetical protein